MAVVSIVTLKTYFQTGDFPTESQFVDLIDTLNNASTSVYKTYVANLTQTGTNAPVATVLENTLGATLVWTYVAVGNYSATLIGAFPTQSKVTIFLSSTLAQNGDYCFESYWNSTAEIKAFTQVNATPTNGLMNPMSIEIRVYP